jgi:voltage-gated potassium channel
LQGEDGNQIEIDNIKYGSLIKQKKYNLVEKDAHESKVNLIFDYLIIALIILNLIAIALDPLLEFLRIMKFMRIFEIVSIEIFFIEFLMR